MSGWVGGWTPALVHAFFRLTNRFFFAYLAFHSSYAATTSIFPYFQLEGQFTSFSSSSPQASYAWQVGCSRAPSRVWTFKAHQEKSKGILYMSVVPDNHVQ